MPKVYISAPYTDKSSFEPEKPYGRIRDKDYMKFLNDVASIIREFGHTVVLPHYMTYEWGDSAIKPEIMMRRAFESLSASDVSCDHFADRCH